MARITDPQIVSKVLRDFVSTNPGMDPLDPKYMPHIQGDIGAAIHEENQFQSAFSTYSAMLPPAPRPTFAQNFRSSFSSGGQGGITLAYGLERTGTAFAQSYSTQNSGQYLTPEQQAQANLGLAPGIGAVGGAVIGAFVGQPVIGAGIGTAVGSGVQAISGAGLEREQSGRLSSQEFAGATGASIAEIKKFTDALMAAGVATQQVASLMSTLSSGTPAVTQGTAGLAIGLSRNLGPLAGPAGSALVNTEQSSPILFGSSVRATTASQSPEFYAEASIIAAGRGDLAGSQQARNLVNQQRQRDLATVADYDRGANDNNPLSANYWHRVAQGWQNLTHHNAPQKAANDARTRLAQPDTATQDAADRAQFVSAGMADVAASLEMGGVDVSRAQSVLGADIYRGASAVEIQRNSGTYRRAIEGEIQGIARGRTAILAEMGKEQDPAHRAILATWAGQADDSINDLRLKQSQFGAENTLSRYSQSEANIGVSIARAGVGVASAQGFGDPAAVYQATTAEIQKQVSLQSQLAEELRKGVPVYEDRIAKEKQIAEVSASIVSNRAAAQYALTTSTEGIQGARISGAESLNPRALRLGGDQAFSPTLLGDLDSAYKYALKASVDSPNAGERAEQKLRADQLLAAEQNYGDIARSKIFTAAVSTKRATDLANYEIAGNLPFIGGLASNPFTQGGNVIRDDTNQMNAATAKFRSLANPTDIDKQNYADTMNTLGIEKSQFERIRMTAAEMSLVTLHEGEGPATRAASSGTNARAALFNPNTMLSGTWDRVRPDNSYGYSPTGGSVTQAFMNAAHVGAGHNDNAAVVDAIKWLGSVIMNGRGAPMQPQKSSPVSNVASRIRTNGVNVYGSN